VIVAWHNHKLRMLDPQTQLVTVITGRGGGFGPCPDAAPAPCTGEGVIGMPTTRFNQPAHAALDPNGNLLMVDQRNQRLRLIRDFVNQLGAATIETVLGTGMPGFNGDGLAPLATQVRFPTGSNPEPTGGIAIDAAGVVYFSDTNNNRIRRVEFNADYSDGVVSTVAGNGTAGARGDGGLGSEAEISFPADLEIGPDGNLYFADTNNNKVRMVDLTTGIITTVAGTGERGYSGDGGQAADAMLSRPFGVAFDEAGDLYISDTFNGRIRRVTR
jgi:streptogramin lyase